MAKTMKYLLYLFGFLPSIIWLAYYLRKDSHPESNEMVVKMFFLGIVSGFMAIIFEKMFQSAFSFINTNQLLGAILVIFIGGALIEEYLKYFVTKMGVFKDSELDEPVDLIIYMIIAALGFAALENILVLSNYHPVLTANMAVETMLWRFVTATFLHALCSGLIGYFLVLAFCKIQDRKGLIFTGILIATFLHGLYNFSIMKIDTSLKVFIPIGILIGLAIFLSYAFKKAKQMKGLCKPYK